MSREEKNLQMATFRVGPHECSLDIMTIKEIVNPLPITPVPKAPDFMEGIVELRGSIVPIVDLRKRFGIEAEDTPSKKHLVVSMDRRIVGLVVDSVTEVISVPHSELRPAPPMITGAEAQPISGMCRYEGRLILILDLSVLLTSREKIKLDALGNADIEGDE
jgi:purine-binding chemotaxis protein CheW